MNAVSLPIEKSSSRVFGVFVFLILTAIGAQIEVPNYPVPFTFQTFFVLLAGAILGKREGALSMIAYVALGAAGLPVFSGGLAGISRLIGPTGGYLLAFPITAFLVGYLLEVRKNYWWIVFSMTLGSIVFFALGTLFLYLTFIPVWSQAFQSGFLIFSWWDAVKIICAAAIAYNYFAKNMK